MRQNAPKSHIKFQKIPVISALTSASREREGRERGKKKEKGMKKGTEWDRFPLEILATPMTSNNMLTREFSLRMFSMRRSTRGRHVTILPGVKSGLSIKGS